MSVFNPYKNKKALDERILESDVLLSKIKNTQ
jgi:hypothetical protein